jgi:hypothetical protein
MICQAVGLVVARRYGAAQKLVGVVARNENFRRNFLNREIILNGNNSINITKVWQK